MTECAYARAVAFTSCSRADRGPPTRGSGQLEAVVRVQACGVPAAEGRGITYP
jgi:hypothetical protein